VPGEEPLVSRSKLCVITVVLNAAAELERTIASVLEQKAHRELDYLIIDGGSTDGTVDVIRRYADRLYFWSSEPDGGVYHAMNKGWSAAPRDSFVLFLGAGDLIISLPQGLDGYGSRDILYGRVLMGEERVFRPRADFHLKLYNSLHHQALLINKGCHPQPPFDTRYRLYADFDLNLRLLQNGARFVEAPDFLSRALPGGLSDHRDFPESLRVIGKNFGLLWLLAAAGSFALMQLLPFLKVLRPFQKLPAGEKN
jgi:glycosyltransferase involved in cell wall biosynthesis